MKAINATAWGRAPLAAGVCSSVGRTPTSADRSLDKLNEAYPTKRLMSPACGRLPEVDRIAFGIVEAGEAVVGVALRVDFDGYYRFAKLRHHRVETPNS